MKAFTRLEARILPEKAGLKNVVTELVVGMTYTDDDSGLSVYRETSMTAEVEAAKSRPISKPFKFQEAAVEA